MAEGVDPAVAAEPDETTTIWEQWPMSFDGTRGAGPSLEDLFGFLRGLQPADPDPGDPIAQAQAEIARRARLPTVGGLFGGDYARFMADRASGPAMSPSIGGAAAAGGGDPLAQLTPSPQAFGPQASGVDADAPTVDLANSFQVAGPVTARQFGLSPSQIGAPKEAEQRGVWAAGDLVRDGMRSAAQRVSQTVDSLRGPQPESPTSTQPVVRWAEAHVGHGGYGKWLDDAPDARSRHDDMLAAIGLHGRGDPKCNQFVWDALSSAGVQPGRLDGGRIPLAKDWGNPKSQIPGYAPTRGALQPGDVVSNGDHVGIYAPLADGRPGTISAASPFHNGGILGGVVHNDWGFRGDEGAITAWRPTGR